MAKKKKLQKQSKSRPNFVDKLPWFWLWGIIYLAILIFGLFWLYSPIITALKLFGILLCLCYVFKFYKKDRLLQAAFLFTLGADFILACNNTAAFGVLIFAFAQLTHFLRICQRPLLRKIWLIVSCLLLVIFFILPIEKNIVCFSAVYGITLIANFATSIYQHHKQHTLLSRITMIGFGLFICCDLLVVVSFLTTVGILPEFLHGFADYLCWVFYLPSQILLANSSRSMIQ